MKTAPPRRASISSAAVPRRAAGGRKSVGCGAHGLAADGFGATAEAPSCSRVRSISIVPRTDASRMLHHADATRASPCATRMEEARLARARAHLRRICAFAPATRHARAHRYSLSPPLAAAESGGLDAEPNPAARHTEGGARMEPSQRFAARRNMLY